VELPATTVCGELLTASVKLAVLPPEPEVECPPPQAEMNIKEVITAERREMQLRRLSFNV
jgi:hypothetical protein